MVSPEIFGAISAIPGFALYPKEVSERSNSFLIKSGRLGNLDVFINTLQTQVGDIETIYMGKKPHENNLFAGLVLSPYQILTEDAKSAKDFGNSRMMLTRYAITPVKNGEVYFGKIEVDVSAGGFPVFVQ